MLKQLTNQQLEQQAVDISKRLIKACRMCDDNEARQIIVHAQALILELANRVYPAATFPPHENET